MDSQSSVTVVTKNPHDEKLEKFKGIDFKRWQHKMFLSHNHESGTCCRRGGSQISRKSNV
ncbi:unnamed protein product [Prunus armeniaca]